MNFLIAAGVAAAAFYGLVRFVHLSAVAATGFAVLAFFGLLFTLSMRRPALSGKPKPLVRKNRSAVLDELFAEAEPAVERLDTASKDIRDGGMRQRYQHLTSSARAILRALDENPADAMRLRRFLLYYLPRAADLAEGAAAMSKQTNPDLARFRALADLTGRLDDAFSRFADSLVDDDLEKLDLEMKLMADALDEDFGRPSSKDSSKD